MSRKGITTRERPSNDIRYTDHPQEMNRNIHKFICGIMYDGKKSIAEKIVFGAFDIISERTKDDPVKVFEKAVANVLPRLESARAASAVRTIRSPSRSAPSAAWPWPTAGLSGSPAPARRRPCVSASPTR